MYISCNEKNHAIQISEIKQNEPFILYLEPYVGELHIDVKLPFTQIKGLCCHLNNQQDSYSLPHYFTDFKKIPELSYLMLFLSGKEYVAVFSLSHKDLLTSFYSQNNHIFLKAASGSTREANKKRAALLILSHRDVYTLMQQCMQIALQETGNYGKIQHKKNVLPSFFNRFGWQSRLAFGLDISHDKIMNSIQSLKQEGFLPGFILIEEGWQQLDVSQSSPSLLAFEADRKKFPGGLKGLIDDLHSEGILSIGVWHAMMGYRGGVHSQLAKLYDLPPDAQGRYFLGYDLGRTFQFYYDYYAFLKEQGVDFIKVGDQENTLTFCRCGMDVTRLYKNLQTAIQAAASLHFQSAQFNGDCLKNENLFYWTTSNVAQTSCSIDYSHPRLAVHAIRNHLVNSLWLQHLMQVDFDSWISGYSHNETLAIFHALSGTFKMISDPPKTHDQNLLKKMILPSGLTLKADSTLTLCEDSLFVNPLEEKKIYKAFTHKGAWGVVGAFNFWEEKPSLSSLISPKDVYQLSGDDFVAFSYRHGFLGIVSHNESIRLKFKSGQSDIITFAPILNGIAVIGYYSFFLAPAPIIEINSEDDALHISAIIAAPLLIYCERQILEIRRNGHVIPWNQDKRCHLVSIDERSQMIETFSYYTISFES